ncbi:adaptor protein MecA [Alkalibacterium sp. 20]|uniref:adaptor protein MecA n=1 Tax=Alkalibacterium sp. 20 TaxID=1798803 RepID=UPI0009004F29|nr:adaptor protein MecA [Alkalibacterium sp. 20]OJF96480.1 adaptor protein MecA [Alkalibacterium sp. 20]
MEIEHINDDTIRVIIENTDLEERGITFLDLLGNQKKIEKFFYSILEEVDIDEEFQESEAVTFQVMPNNNGLELFISKGTNFKDDDDSLDTLKEQIDDNINQNEESLDEIDEYAKGDNTTKEVVIALEGFEQMVSLSKSLFLESGISTLYSYKNRYYLHLTFFVEEMVEKTSDEEIAIALEFGNKTNTTPEVLNEYAEKIMETNALELMRYHFK